MVLVMIFKEVSMQTDPNDATRFSIRLLHWLYSFSSSAGIGNRGMSFGASFAVNILASINFSSSPPQKEMAAKLFVEKFSAFVSRSLFRKNLLSLQFSAANISCSPAVWAHPLLNFISHQNLSKASKCFRLVCFFLSV